MSKNTVRMYLLTSFVGGVGGIIFLGVALYSTQLLVRTLAFIAGGCVLLASALLIYAYIIGSRGLRDKKRTEEF